MIKIKFDNRLVITQPINTSPTTMSLDQEEIQAWKDDRAERLAEVSEAKKKVDFEIPDFLVSPYGRDGGRARFNDKMSSDELFKLAKFIEEMADCKKGLEYTEFQMKKAGISL